jgi:sensor histidine kinase YesM
MELLELKALQSQMNPHFMSNTLHSIYWKTFQLTRSPNEACRMIEQLSDLLEYGLRGLDDSVKLRDDEQVRCALRSDSPGGNGKRVGLFNTSKRLSLHYGQSDLLRIVSKQGSGTAVTLAFPQPTATE